MRILTRIVMGLVIVVLITAAVGYFFIQLQGRELVVRSLSQVFDRPVIVEDIHFLFPFGVRIKDLTVEDTLKVKDVKIQMGLPDFWHQRLNFFYVNLIEPQAVVERTADSKIVWGKIGEVKSDDQSNQPQTPSGISTDATKQSVSVNKNLQMAVVIKFFSVEKGQIQFRDLAHDHNFSIDFQDVGLKARDVSFPETADTTHFDLTAVMFKTDLPFTGSRVESQGWFNLGKKDMDADLKVFEPDVKNSLSARLQAKHNDMMVDGKVYFKNVRLNWKADESISNKSIADLLVSSLRATGFEMAANFHFKTKMDDFQVDAVSFSGNLGYQGTKERGDDKKTIGEHLEELGIKVYQQTLEQRQPANTGNSATPVEQKSAP